MHFSSVKPHVDVAAAQRGQEALSKLKEATGNSKVEFAQLDIADPKSVDAFGAWARKELQNVDILINNAGVGSCCPPLSQRHCCHVADIHCSMSATLLASQLLCPGRW